MGSSRAGMIMWDEAELATLLPPVQQLMRLDYTLAGAFEKAQLLLPAHRRRTHSSIKALCRPGQSLERAYSAVSAASAKKRKITVTLDKKPMATPEPVQETAGQRRVAWVRREWQMMGLAMNHYQPLHPDLSLARAIEKVQDLIFAPDRRRSFSSLSSSRGLAADIAQGERDSWQLTPEQRQFVLDALDGKTTGQSEAQAVEAVVATAQVQAPMAPAVAPPVQAPVQTTVRATPQEVNADKVAAILAGTASQLFDVFNAAVADTLMLHMEPIVALIAERMTGLADMIVEQVRATASADAIRSMVHDMVNAELGSPAPTPAPASAAPQPEPPAEVPPAPVAAPTGPTFTLGEEQDLDALEAEMRSAVEDWKPAPYHGPKIKVDVVGLDGKAISVIKQRMNGAFAANFVSAEATRSNWRPAENVVVWTRNTSAWTTHKAKDAGSRVLVASGGINSILERLEELKNDRLEDVRA